MFILGKNQWEEDESWPSIFPWFEVHIVFSTKWSLMSPPKCTPLSTLGSKIKLQWRPLVAECLIEQKTYLVFNQFVTTIFMTQSKLDMPMNWKGLEDLWKGTFEWSRPLGCCHVEFPTIGRSYATPTFFFFTYSIWVKVYMYVSLGMWRGLIMWTRQSKLWRNYSSIHAWIKWKKGRWACLCYLFLVLICYTKTWDGSIYSIKRHGILSMFRTCSNAKTWEYRSIYSINRHGI